MLRPPETFAMVVAVRPKSQQSGGRNEKYKERLRATAGAYCMVALTGPLYARIIWFQLLPSQGDVDNIAKPILDALKTVVYHDDDQIVRCLTQKTVTSSPTFLMTPGDAPVETAQYDLEDLVGIEQHVLYIEVGPVTDPKISFGPVG